MRLSRRLVSFFPSPSELAWYAGIRILRSWALHLPEEEIIKRTESFSSRVAASLGRPAASFVAMGRGIVQTVYYRTRRIRIIDRLDADSKVKWERFQHEARSYSRAIFVSAHLGPFQLQMDLLAQLPHQILLLFRSYKWAPLARELDALRLKSDRFYYVDVTRKREILKALDQGQSIAILGDGSGRPGDLELFGRPVLDDFPARLAARLAVPIFVGGLFNIPRVRHNGNSDAHSFGLDYCHIPPSDPASMRRDFVSAMEKTILNNPSDWVCFAASNSDQGTR